MARWCTRRRNSTPWFEQDRVFIEAVRTGNRALLLNDYADGLYSLAPVLAGWESARRGGELIAVAEFMAELSVGRIARRWGAAGGYREFLGIALPLILSTASWSIQHFVDRVFLSWYSTEALAAALPAGMANFTFISLFMGTAQYANTFVAQYMGARRPTRVGPAVWQGAYVALFSGLLALLPAAFAGELFALIGHDPDIRAAETDYFRILCYGTGPQVLSTAFSCFFSGRGQTWVVLAVNVVAISVNIICDYALIFGHWGLPELGIVGAAWATNIGLVVSALCFAVLFLGPRLSQRIRHLARLEARPQTAAAPVALWRPQRRQLHARHHGLYLLLVHRGPLGANHAGGDELGLSHQQPRLYAAHWLQYCCIDDDWPALGARSARSR